MLLWQLRQEGLCRMNGVKLCCEFSGIPNKLEFCGPIKSFEVFADFLKTGNKEQEVRDLLTKFEGLYPYLKLIADKHSLDPFDERVVEAYWIGNELLDSFTIDDLKRFLPRLELPEKLTIDLQDRVPVALPCHLFNVLFVGVGRITGSVPTNVENMQKCMISWGKVIEVNDEIIVSGPVLEWNGKYVLSEKRRAISSLVKPKVGDWIAIHWNEIVHILSDKQVENLEKYTRKIIAAVNAQPLL